MAELEVKSAALWLGKLAVNEINYLGEVRDKVEALERDLNMLSGFVMEAVKSRRQDKVLQIALSDSRDVAYDCQDVIEMYMLHVARKGYEQYEGCQLRSAFRWACLLWKAVRVHGIHSKINALNKRVATLKSNLESFGVIAQITNNNNRQLIRPTLGRVYTHDREDFEPVGLDDQLAELVDRLMDSTDKTVITICGMGGVGKSTMARELYHHRTLREGGYFQAFGWATASQRLQPERVLRTIMYSLVPENDVERRREIDGAIKADRAHATLYYMMKEVKWLVVIDDIWTSEDWNQLQHAFPKKFGIGSRLVLTTRNEYILSSCQDQVHLHPVHGLDDTNSWLLFEKITFPGSTCTDSRKTELGRQMLQHCKGVPLAIVVLGRLLKTKQRVEDWRQIRNEIFAQIASGGTIAPYKEVYDVLQVSYDELPFHLKQCFLHFANYPEDFKISASVLYQKWVAEGIVSKEDTTELEEDIAERYLNELVSRNMVQVVDWHFGGESIRRCRIHDLMRDVCIRIARREGFLQQLNCHTSLLHVKNANHLLMTPLPERDKRLRRLAVHVSQHQEPQTSSIPTTAASPTSTFVDVSRAPNLRTLLIFPINEQQRQEGVEEDCTRLMETISMDYPLLRVFDCADLPIKGKLPKKLGDLIHLRYLGLGGTRITEVPSSVEKLQWLQTLDLRTCVGVVVSLPNILWKLKQLRHLFLPDLDFFEEPGSDKPRYLIEEGGELLLDDLYNLQTLVYIDLDTVSLEGLSKLIRLRLLSATCETKRTALHPFLNCTSLRRVSFRLYCQILNEEPMILSSCEALKTLVLYGKEGSSMNLKKPLHFEMLPIGLVELALWYLQLNADPLPVLEQLPNLQSLMLNRCDCGSMMACSVGGFPQLTEIFFVGLSMFDRWEVEEGALPKLEYLELTGCPLKKAPDAIPYSVNVFIK